MVAIYSTSLLASSITLLASFVNAYGQVAQVIDSKNFCVFLPPNDSANRNIADTEWNAQAFCLGKTPEATNAGKLASGFIKSAHFLQTDKYVQVTGQINPIKARLNVTDDGGQMDIKAPKGSSCAGWKYYVNLIEPTGKTFCMRCCNDDRTCNRGISEKGCAHIIPGDYSGPYGPGTPNSNTDEPISSSSSKAAKSTTTQAVKSTTAEAPKTTEASKAVETAVASSTLDSAGAASASSGSSATTVGLNSAASSPSASAASSTTASAAPAVSTVAKSTNTESSSSISSQSSSTKNSEMLSQNNDITEQSVSGAYQFQPTIMTFVALLISSALMA
ncbi:hypothetical protein BD560DRAFT_493651 [Blakeslea trispora]|nr:hypothetical protein BD560DRAFT_493651 [Blakeslea trispora]